MRMASVRSAFSVMELLVTLAIIALLAALLFPVFAGARRQTYKAVCASNLRQLGQALEMYRQDWGQYPLEGWVDTAQVLEPVTDPLAPYAKTAALYHCPEAGLHPYNYRASLEIGADDETGSAYRLFQLAPSSAIGYCVSHVQRDKAGRESGFYQVLREDQSVTRVPAESVGYWTYRDGQWLPPGTPARSESPEPTAAVFPGEPFPLPFLSL